MYDPNELTMQEEELKKIWNRSGDRNLININLKELIPMMKNKMDTFERRIRRRDLIETIACFFVIISFSFIGFKSPFLSSKIASLLTISWGFFVIYRLRKARKKRKPEDFSLSLEQQLTEHKQFLERQKKLLSTAWKWYALPPFIIHVIFLLGMGDPADYGRTASFLGPDDLAKKLLIIGVVAVLTVFIIFTNQKVVSLKINPAIDEVSQLQQQLAETNE